MPCKGPVGTLSSCCEIPESGFNLNIKDLKVRHEAELGEVLGQESRGIWSHFNHM